MQAKSLEAAVSHGEGDIEKFLFCVSRGTADAVAILIANFITPTEKKKEKRKKERTSSSNRRYHAEEVELRHCKRILKYTERKRVAEREGKLERKAGGTSKIPEKTKEGSYVTRKESKSGKEKKQRHSEAKAGKKEATLRTKIQNVVNVAWCFRARI